MLVFLAIALAVAALASARNVPVARALFGSGSNPVVGYVTVSEGQVTADLDFTYVFFVLNSG